MLRREALLWYRGPSPRAVFLGLALIGATTSAAAMLGKRPAETVFVPQVTTTVVPVMHAVAVAPTIVKGGRDDFGFVFRSGGATYLMLAEAGEDVEALPKHGALQLVSENEWSAAVVAEVAAADVPEPHRRWAAREVLVEGGCRARVTGFALVARLTGDTSYAQTEAKTWTAEATFASGARVLAARLDGCHGSYGRDAGLSPIAEASPVDGAAAASSALDDFLASKPVVDAQKTYEADGGKGLFHETNPESIDTRVVRHPVTGVIWVSIYAHYSEGCGGPQLDVWGMYSVDAHGEVVREHVGALENISRIDRLIDVDGDGRFEAITRDWLGMTQELRDESGKPMQRLEVPFYGCPC